MRRSEIIKLIIVIISLLLSLFFAIENYNTLNLVNSFVPIIFFIMAIPLFMLYKRDKYKKSKYINIYDWIIFASITLIIVILGYEFYFSTRGVRVTSFDFSYSELYVSNVNTTYVDNNITGAVSSMSMILYFISLYTLLLVSLDDIDKKTNKVNYVMTIVASLIMIFIYSNYYLNINFNINSNYLKESTVIFITQNYIYFAIMYIAILIHKFIYKFYKKES